ncbi:MAG: glycosyltransferase family 4 protein [Phycisphaerae bacterium]
MKVALVTEWLDAWRGGAETSTLQFMHHVMDAGVELHVFTRSRPSPAPGLHVHTISGARMSRTRQSATFATRVDRIVRADAFDVVHAISPCRCADVYQPRGGTVAETIERNVALRAPGAARTLKRCAVRFNVKQRYLLSMERKLLGQDAGPIVVAISEYVCRQLKRHYALPDERIRKIYNGVDPDPTPSAERERNRAEIRGTYGIGSDDLAILLVAHNFRLKGVHRWMEAQRRLLQRFGDGLRSIVVGKGDSARWHRLAERNGLTAHLALAGPTSRVRTFYHAADVLVHPTYYDPCSRVVLEAMVSGLPCITTRWDGAAEMITDGINGYVLDRPDDIDALVDRVERLRDPALRHRLGRAASKTVDRVAMHRHAAEVLDLYDSVAAAGALR